MCAACGVAEKLCVVTYACGVSLAETAADADCSIADETQLGVEDIVYTISMCDFTKCTTVMVVLGVVPVFGSIHSIAT